MALHKSIFKRVSILAHLGYRNSVRPSVTRWYRHYRVKILYPHTFSGNT